MQNILRRRVILEYEKNFNDFDCSEFFVAEATKLLRLICLVYAVLRCQKAGKVCNKSLNDAVSSKTTTKFHIFVWLLKLYFASKV